MSAEVVSASLPKTAHACLTSCSGTHRVERVERSGKEVGAVSCCCDCCEKVVVMRRRLLAIERGESQAAPWCMEYTDYKARLPPCKYKRALPWIIGVASSGGMSPLSTAFCRMASSTGSHLQ